MRLYEKNYLTYALVPVILFIAFLFMVFYFPGIEQGIDLKGGTLIIIRTENPVNAGELEFLLEERFSLTDLRVDSISSPAGYGITIQFAENRVLSDSAIELLEAKNALSQKNDSEAILRANNAVALLSPFIDESIPPELSARDAVEKADELFSKARDSFHNQIKDLVEEKFGLKKGFFFQLREIGPQLGKAFWDNAVLVGIIAFIGIIVVIFFFFREIIPASLIIFAGIFDVVAALAGMSLFSIPLSLSSIPALLMLLGYSVDTDVLLTTRVLKRREKTPRDRTIGAIGTGLTMTLTSLAVVMVMLAVSYFSQIMVIFEIALVLFFGLIGDLIVTWLLNAPVLLWFVERKRKKVVF